MKAIIVLIFVFLFSVDAFVSYASSAVLRTKLLATPVAKEALDQVAKNWQSTKNPLPSLKEQESKFKILTSGLGNDETKAAKVLELFPQVLFVDSTRLRDNLELMASTWGVDKTCDVLLRNPNVLSTATKGYGSLEASLSKGQGGDIVGMSYVIAATRPAGPVLLGLLGIALLKAVIFGVDV
jgi:hypothetical protein